MTRVSGAMDAANIPIFVINLDRRPDRLSYMQEQLDGLGLNWERVSAKDAQLASDAEIAREVQLHGHRVGMGRGSQCCAITNFDIFRTIAGRNLPAALILQDDIALSPQIGAFLRTLDWLPEGIGLVQFEKFGRANSTRLAGPGLGAMPVPGRSLHRLYSRTAGAGAFLITRQAASLVLEKKPLLDMPIDHFLFSPNVSPLFDQLGVAIVTPALAVQRMEDFASDIAAERQRQRKDLGARAYRLALELNRVPHQLVAMMRGARWIPFGYVAHTSE